MIAADRKAAALDGVAQHAVAVAAGRPGVPRRDDARAGSCRAAAAGKPILRCRRSGERIATATTA